MRAGLGFTLIELIFAMAIVGVLATLSYASYESSWEKSNFRSMREFGVELALKQQLHRQRYGQYAKNVASTGMSDANRLVLPSAVGYQIVVYNPDFRGYRAEIKPSPDAPLKLPEACKILIVESELGIQRFGARSASNQDTSSTCVPHG
nr:prepilin-type N-terminal cleavage/methylation domain-containing protein [uncultured Limnobacter sp.]